MQLFKFFLPVLILCCTTLSSNLYSQCFNCQNAPEGTIFCDDFEDETPLDKKYFEINNNNGDFIRMEKVGRDESFGMRVKWQKGEVGAGGLSKSFGKTPSAYIGKNASRPNESFTEIYWRMDIKAQEGWTGGGPAKLSRALCMANSNWAQGMMAHLWSGGPNNLYLGMDPASGIGTDGALKSTKYNDFPNLRWLGFKAGNIDLFSTENSAKWYCIVGHVKLNTPGQKDGVFQFWINDTLQASSTNLDWHSTWNSNPANLHINAIFFENYWNSGSPVEQERYFDNIVISTKPIPCKCQITYNSDQQKESQWIVVSNPVTKELHITLRDLKKPNPIYIYDIHGRMIYQNMLQSELTILNLNHLENGIYVLKSEAQMPFKLLLF
jgi:hypothetical protein